MTTLLLLLLTRDKAATATTPASSSAHSCLGVEWCVRHTIISVEPQQKRSNCACMVRCLVSERWFELAWLVAQRWLRLVEAEGLCCFLRHSKLIH